MRGEIWCDGNGTKVCEISTENDNSNNNVMNAKDREFIRNLVNNNNNSNNSRKTTKKVSSNQMRETANYFTRFWVLWNDLVLTNGRVSSRRISTISSTNWNGVTRERFHNTLIAPLAFFFVAIYNYLYQIKRGKKNDVTWFFIVILKWLSLHNCLRSINLQFLFSSFV